MLYRSPRLITAPPSATPSSCHRPPGPMVLPYYQYSSNDRQGEKKTEKEMKTKAQQNKKTAVIPVKVSKEQRRVWNGGSRMKVPELRTYGIQHDEHHHYGIQHVTAACSRIVPRLRTQNCIYRASVVCNGLIINEFILHSFALLAQGR